MVQERDWVRDHSSQSQPPPPPPHPPLQWPLERLPANEPVPDSIKYPRHEPTSEWTRPVMIQQALRDQCRIPCKSYFLAAVLDNGDRVIFSGPSEHKGDVGYFFDMDRWVHYVDNGFSTAFLSDGHDTRFEDGNRMQHPLPPRFLARQGHGPGQSIQGQGSDVDYSPYGLGPGLEAVSRRPMDRRRQVQQDNRSDDAARLPKRQKASRSADAGRAGPEPSDEPVVHVTRPIKIPVRVSDEEKIWNLYDQRFRNMQQNACKLIAKAWVKLVEPKKQSNHPYTGSDEKAPDWWPKPWGNTREEKVRHKEPDHLYKRERIHLLKHIIRMIVVPNSEQHQDIQKLNLNVAKLEEATYDAMSGFFNDKEFPSNMRRKPFLKEVFLLAKYEERYRNGEIDGSTCIYVNGDNKIPDEYQSDNEDSSPSKEEEAQEAAPAAAAAVVPHMIQQQPAAGPSASLPAAVSPVEAASDHSPNSALHPPTSFLSEVAPRSPAPTFGHQPQILHADLGNEQQHPSYVEGASSAMASGTTHGSSGMPLHDISRRASLFSSGSEFPQASATPTVYQAWQHQTSTAPPNTSPLYSFTPHPAPPSQGPSQAHGPAHAHDHGHQAQPPPAHGSYLSQSSVSMSAQSPGYIGHSFDTMPRGAYSATQDSSGLFRPGNIPPPPPGPLTTPSDYPMHMPHPGSRGLPSHTLKNETSARGHLN